MVDRIGRSVPAALGLAFNNLLRYDFHSHFWETTRL